jgi:hypothetical protein
MAAWGSGSFDNEDASNWLGHLPQLTTDDLKALLSRAENSDYLAGPESGEIVAAAEVVAALVGSPNATLPRQITEWVAAKSNSNAAATLSYLAVRAVHRVRTNSELKDLWLQADGLNEWSANLRDLEERLAAAKTPVEITSTQTQTIADAAVTDARTLLRHTVATLAYRGGKAVRNAPASFADYRCAESARTPGQILAHIGDLMDWALSIAEGRQQWNNTSRLPWEKEIERFHAALKKFDDYLASAAPLHDAESKLFQGPVADALTHVGQIAMLRRMAGGPVRGENYFVAEITAGRVGADQSPPHREFD